MVGLLIQKTAVFWQRGGTAGRSLWSHFGLCLHGRSR